MTKFSNVLNDQESPWTRAIRKVLGIMLMMLSAVVISVSGLDSAFLFVGGVMLFALGIALLFYRNLGEPEPKPEPLLELGINPEHPSTFSTDRKS